MGVRFWCSNSHQCIYARLPNCRKPNDNERYIYVSDDKIVQVEIIEVFRLLLKIGFYLDLNETFVVLSFDGI